MLYTYIYIHIYHLSEALATLKYWDGTSDFQKNKWISYLSLLVDSSSFFLSLFFGGRRKIDQQHLQIAGSTDLLLCLY